MTSLNAPGFSLSLLNITGIHARTETLTRANCYALLDASTTALAWVGAWQHKTVDLPDNTNDTLTSSSEISNRQGHDVDFQPKHILPLATKNAIRGACARVLQIQNELTQYDTLVGDGDCGETFASGAIGKLTLLMLCHCALPAILNSYSQGLRRRCSRRKGRESRVPCASYRRHIGGRNGRNNRCT